MRARLISASALVCAAAGALPPGALAADSNCPNAHATPDRLSVSEYADSLLCVVNETRNEWGRDPLTPQRNLRRAAAWQADDMTANDYFSHISSDGDSLADRLDHANFIPSSDRWEAGENLAAGRADRGTPAAIVSGWMQSRDHRLNLLDPAFTLVGIAASRGWPVRDESDQDALTIAMDLGWRRL
jgi:uncharacterized protein YkwD